MILCDAETRFDPTGTSAIRARFRGENDRRWARLRVLLVTAITKHDLLALDPNKIESIGRTTDRVQGFEAWLGSALKSIVTSDETWIKAGVLSAVGRAHERASRWGEPSKSPHDRSAHLQSLAVAEFKGLCNETLRRCVRIVAHGLLAKVRAGAVASQVAKEINVAKKRGRMAANHSVVLAHGKATLDAFRARGITHVGVTPERKPKVHAADAVGWSPGLEGAKASRIFARIKSPKQMPSKRQLEKIERAEEELQRYESVEVLTAGDEKVCDECQDISDEGPYDVDTAESLIPAHLECRCAFVPADDARFANVRE